jgi:hypothetical protein
MTQKTIQGNQAKYLSYKLAHARMKSALNAEFPLETIAIAESLMTDRLLSYVNYHGTDFDPDKTTLGKVAPKAAKICQENKDETGYSLTTQAKNWMQQRNEVLHSIAKSGQGKEPKIPANQFLEHALEVAKNGIVLVKAIQTWHKNLIRMAKKHNE